MKQDLENLENKNSPETKAEEELLELGLPSLPENIQAVIDQHKTFQHPEGFERIVELDSLENVADAMKEENIKRLIHAEGPNLWIHSKFAIKLVEFLDIPEEKKRDLKLIMLYHDLGKTTPGMEERPEIQEIQRKELEKGKLYQVSKGHATERSQDIEAGFMANGISGRKLEVFMDVVKSHMGNHLSEMSGLELVKLFEPFGRNDDERKETAELLAFTIQVDGNACSQIELCPDGQLQSPKKVNTTGEDFDKIWAKYIDSKKESGAK